MKPPYTPRQGQILAFIHYHTKLNGCPPAEADMARRFNITPANLQPFTPCMLKTQVAHPALAGSLSTTGSLDFFDRPDPVHLQLERSRLLVRDRKAE